MNKLLIIEDDHSINKIISYALSSRGYHVDSLFDGKQAIEHILSDEYDLVLIDWMLPIKDGLTIIREARNRDYTKPIIFLTAKSSDEDIVEGLESGADDYLTKPFKTDVLVARIEAHLRRYHKHFKGTLKYANIKMDLNKREVKVDEEIILLTKVEYDLLKMFLEHQEQVLSRQEILENIWNFSYDGDTRLVDIHVFKLKSKLKKAKVGFKSIRGVGYKLVIKDE